jgi:acetyl esterase/lipase
MTSLRLRVMAGCAKPIMRWRMGRVQDAANVRQMFERAAKYMFRGPHFANYARTTFVSDRPRQAVWASTGPVARDKVILYLHGGGFLAGSPWGYRKLAAHLSRAAGLRCFVPSYRLAPEDQLPASLEDALAAHAHLLNLGYKPSNIVIGGDSAGGGLAFSVLAALCESGQQPAAVFGWSPCLDLTYSGASVVENADKDHIFPGARVHDLSAMILGDVPAKDPRISPLFAEFTNCPPVLLQVSDTEIMRDDSTRMDAKLRAQGCDARLEVWNGAPHVWHFLCGYVPDALEAVENTGFFIKQHTADA